MADIVKLDSVKTYNEYMGWETLHPLVSVVDFDEIPQIINYRLHMGIFAIFLKYIKCGDMTYGCQSYDYEDGTLVFVSPGQVYGIDSKGVALKPSGKALVFHPDLLKGTPLGSRMKEYTFFNYEVNEALHLSLKEREIITDCLQKIALELRQSIDKHSKILITSNIELLLNYCMRFYDRQFITRTNQNKDILTRFEQLIDTYLNHGKGEELGLPTVSYFASQLFLSPNYFGDLIKKESGIAPQEYIHQKLLDVAKLRIKSGNQSLQEISLELGFRHQQHFTRFFKQKTGFTPNAYRGLN